MLSSPYLSLPSRLLRALLASVALSVAASTAFAQTADSITTEYNEIQKRIRLKLASGERTPTALAPELAEIDALLANHSDKSDAAARVAYARATLYTQVLGDSAKGNALLVDLVKDFEGTKTAEDVKRQLAARQQGGGGGGDRAAAHAAVVGKPAPELNFEWSSHPEWRKLSDLKGRVVVIDFWATWCGPCIASFPKIREKADYFAGSPVTILGVTSLQGRVIGADRKPHDTKDNPQQEYELTAQFMKDKDMTWPVVFSREKVFNPDYAVRGIPHVAIIAPDGTVRHNGLHPNRSELIQEHVIALLKEFNLPLPAAGTLAKGGE